MTQQNINANEHASKKKKDPTTETAYGDPVIASSPTINNDYKKATSTIAESTQNDGSGSSNANENAGMRQKDPTTYTAYGDPAE